jgi:hypothetical protein
MRTGNTTIAVLAAAIALAACGGGDGDSGGERSQSAGRSGPAAVKVIRDWADTLRRGDVEGAARFFAVPSVVSNGTPPITLRSLADAREFNAGLPCGARLVNTSSAGRFTTATFRLTERPGRGRCGTGTGLTAKTTFVISGGKIREWRRVPDRPAPATPAAPAVES